MMDDSQTGRETKELAKALAKELVKALDKDIDETIGDNPQGEDVEAEEVKGIPFGMVGATLLTNILQYSLLVGLSMVILIIMRIFMPASMLAP